MDKSTLPRNLVWMEKALLTPLCREDSEPKNSQNPRLSAVPNDHVKIGPVTGIEANKPAVTLVIEAHDPSQQSGKFEVLGSNVTRH